MNKLNTCLKMLSVSVYMNLTFHHHHCYFVKILFGGIFISRWCWWASSTAHQKKLIFGRETIKIYICFFCVLNKYGYIVFIFLAPPTDPNAPKPEGSTLSPVAGDQLVVRIHALDRMYHAKKNVFKHVCAVWSKPLLSCYRINGICLSGRQRPWWDYAQWFKASLA